MTNMIYLAYGSNMDKTQMAKRCPAAKPIGLAILPDFQLVFKFVADIVPAPGFSVPVIMWQLTDECELTLDRYEGFQPRDPDGGLYRKLYWQDADQSYMAYVMNGYGISPPSQHYFDGIKRGYEQFGADLSFLNAALTHSLENPSGNGYVRKPKAKKPSNSTTKPIPLRKSKAGFWKGPVGGDRLPF